MSASELLPIVIYILLIILIAVFIVVGIKLIITLKKVDEIVDDVNGKISSLNKLFDIVNFATDRMSMVTEVLIGFATGLFNKVKKTRKKSKKTQKEEEIDE